MHSCARARPRGTRRWLPRRSSHHDRTATFRRRLRGRPRL